MQPIEFYFDPISPFAYLGSVQIERLAARLNRRVEWKPVLIGITILKVMGLKPLPETPLKSPYLKHDALRIAEYFDVPFRYHGLKGIKLACGASRVRRLAGTRSGACKIAGAENVQPAMGSRPGYHACR